eukprot:2113086-Rhodomonas_salina.2
MGSSLTLPGNPNLNSPRACAMQRNGSNPAAVIRPAGCKARPVKPPPRGSNFSKAATNNSVRMKR